jgi:alpha-mannosidase
LAPHNTVRFALNGSIESLIDKRLNRELCGSGLALNTLLIGEDIPLLWDNWDIDVDQHLKMAPIEDLVSRSHSQGPLQFRLRHHYKIGQSSELWQDIVFHKNTARIDFDTKVDWKEKHSLLKTSFDLNIRCASYKSDIQFGCIDRPNHSNNVYDRAKFEVCQHKWTDISEPGYGVALLNDGKYGIGVNQSDLRLSLLKSGGHPDPSGDRGVHIFKYALLPHMGGFSASSVVHPAYMFNQSIPSALMCMPTNESIIRISSPHIIVETLKVSESGEGWIARVFECEGTGGHAQLVFRDFMARIVQCNMLEECEQLLGEQLQSIDLYFHAFEVKTLMMVQK